MSIAESARGDDLRAHGAPSPPSTSGVAPAVRTRGNTTEPAWIALARASLTEARAERDKIDERIANLERLERLAIAGGIYR